MSLRSSTPFSRANYTLTLRPLLPGEVVFVKRGDVRLLRPPGRIAAYSFALDLVGENGRQLPLSHLYNHHYIIYDPGSLATVTEPAANERLLAEGTSFHAGPCDFNLFYTAGGAEWRSLQAHLVRRALAPEGYAPSAAWVTSASDHFLAEMHFIDLRHVGDSRNCVQCNCDCASRCAVCRG